jgi:hypothetical protein
MKAGLRLDTMMGRTAPKLKERPSSVTPRRDYGGWKGRQASAFVKTAARQVGGILIDAPPLNGGVFNVRQAGSAKRVMEGVVKHLEKELNLPVNQEKSEVANIKKVPFLGFRILREKIRVGNKARTKFKKRLRELTKRNNPLSMHQIIR